MKADCTVYFVPRRVEGETFTCVVDSEETKLLEGFWHLMIVDGDDKWHITSINADRIRRVDFVPHEED